MDKASTRERHVVRGLDRVDLITALTTPKDDNPLTAFTLTVVENKEETTYNFWVTAIEDIRLLGGTDLKITGKASKRTYSAGEDPIPSLDQRFEDAEEVIFMCNLERGPGRIMFF